MLSTYCQELRLNWWKEQDFPQPPTALHFSLHIGVLNATGANEVTDTYASGRAVLNVSDITEISDFATLRTIKNAIVTSWGASIAAGSIPWIGVWDLSTGGNFLNAIQLVDGLGSPNPLVFGAGDSISLAANAINILQLDTNGWSVYLQDAFLNWYRGVVHPTAPTDTLIGLFTSLTAANVGTEVTSIIRPSGRLAITSSGWSALETISTSQQIKNTNAANFGNSAGFVSNLSYAAIYDAATSGNLLVFAQISSRDISAGEPISIDANSIKLRVG